MWVSGGCRGKFRCGEFRMTLTHCGAKRGVVQRVACECALSAPTCDDSHTPPRETGAILDGFEFRDFDFDRRCYRVLPQSAWPQPHPSDYAFSRVKLYVYRSLLPAASEVIRVTSAQLMQLRPENGRSAAGTAGPPVRDCLVRSCDLGWGGLANLRQFTSDVPILLRMLQTATLVSDPADADGFLVPIPLGTYTAVSWQMNNKGKPQHRRTLRALLARELPHLNDSTASRHIFLQTIDSCMMGLGEMRASPWIPYDAIVVHLGDDKSSAGNVQARSGRLQKRSVRFNNSLVVPYRSALPPPPPPSSSTKLTRPAAREESTRRPLLVYGTYNTGRHVLRGELSKAVLSSARAMGIHERVHVSEMGNPVDDASFAAADGGTIAHSPPPPPLPRPRRGGKEIGKEALAAAAAHEARARRFPQATALLQKRAGFSLAGAVDLARNATFCLCPSGDAPSFTQRLYTTMFAGCIPVFLDLYNRRPAEVTGPSFPFPRSIDWGFAVHVPENFTSAARLPRKARDSSRGEQAFLTMMTAEFERLLPRLLALEPFAAERRRRVLAAAPLLKFDAHGPDGTLRHADAASALLIEVAAQLGVTLAPSNVEATSSRSVREHGVDVQPPPRRRVIGKKRAHVPRNGGSE